MSLTVLIIFEFYFTRSLHIWWHIRKSSHFSSRCWDWADRFSHANHSHQFTLIRLKRQLTKVNIFENIMTKSVFFSLFALKPIIWLQIGFIIIINRKKIVNRIGPTQLPIWIYFEKWFMLKMRNQCENVKDFNGGMQPKQIQFELVLCVLASDSCKKTVKINTKSPCALSCDLYLWHVMHKMLFLTRKMMFAAQNNNRTKNRLSFF